MSNPAERALEKATKNISELLRQSPEGLYLSQITGKLMINNDLAYRALKVLNVVFENGMYVLPVEEKQTEQLTIESIQVQCEPSIISTDPEITPQAEQQVTAPADAVTNPKKQSKMASFEEKVLQLLKDFPDGFTRKELQAQANLNDTQVYNTIHAIRKHTPVYNNLVDGKFVYSLIENLENKPVSIPKPPTRSKVDPSHNNANLDDIKPALLETNPHTGKIFAGGMDSSVKFQCSMSWSEGTSKIELKNCIDPILVEAVLDYIHEHQGRAA